MPDSTVSINGLNPGGSEPAEPSWRWFEGLYTAQSLATGIFIGP